MIGILTVMRQEQSHFRSPLRVCDRRPKSLSDPSHDHTVEHTQALLSKRDEQLTWSDYQCVLGPFLPAGTYRESVYFLPLAFEYIASHDDDAIDLVTSIVWFVSEYADDLEQDNLLDAARDRIAECFGKWSSQFSVTHFDFAACKVKGWGLPYIDYVKNVEVICEAACDLFRFKRHADLAESFFRSLSANKTDAIQAAWLLELARSYSDVYHPPKNPVIAGLLTDRETLESAALLARPLIAAESSPTYWIDTFNALMITA